MTSSATMRVAVAQLAGTPDVDDNLAQIERLVVEAVEKGAGLIAFPEAVMFDFTASAAAITEAARSHSERFQEAVLRIAKKHGIVIVAGLYGEGHGVLATNSLIAAGPDGRLLARYEKLHLYDAFSYRESDKNQAAPLKPDFGELSLLEVGGITFGLMNCYDLRFPEMGRLLVDRGADVILISSGWVGGPHKEAHWATLLKARAIENTCYVAASCQPPPLSVGLSMIIDPIGIPLARVADGRGLAIADVSLDRLKEVRAILPCLQHRRYSVVQKT